MLMFQVCSKSVKKESTSRFAFLVGYYGRIMRSCPLAVLRFVQIAIKTVAQKPISGST